MKTLHIARGPSTDEGTFGVATLDNSTWVSLELPDRSNKPDISCIPKGTYKTVFIYSPHFNRKVYRLLDVPGRENVEIHPANWAGDTSLGWHSDLKGCITLGLEEVTIPNPKGKVQAAVYKSTVAIDDLEDEVGDDTLEVIIT